MQYIILAVLVVFVTARGSYYVDELDKKTKLSGALIGGVLLAVVTSLPELITTLTSTIALQNPGMAFGNVFGSNLFNFLILAVVDLLFIKHLFFNKTRDNVSTVSLGLIMYVTFILPIVMMGMGLLNLDWLGISIGLSFNVISLVIITIYVISVRRMGHDLLPKSVRGSKHKLSTINMRFAFYATLVVVVSYMITHVASELSETLNMSASFGGALLLGAATSLPEFTAVITLFKLRNYAVAVGNVVGSNIFNMLILSIVDLVYIKENIYRVFDDDVLFKNISLLLILGALNSIMVLVALKRKAPNTTIIYILPSVTIILLYGVYIVLSL